jgi:hypothetical protein
VVGTRATSGCRRGKRTAGWAANLLPHSQEDDVTDPGSATDADRAEQEALLDPPAVSSAADATAPAADVPEADALEQQLAARRGEAGSPQRPVGDRDGSEADILEQDAEVPVDEEES